MDNMNEFIKVNKKQIKELDKYIKSLRLHKRIKIVKDTEANRVKREGRM